MPTVVSRDGCSPLHRKHIGDIASILHSTFFDPLITQPLRASNLAPPDNQTNDSNQGYTYDDRDLISNGPQ
jgi:hypothetical protein